MFTGIVEGVGSLSEVKATGGGFRMRIHTPVSSAMKEGDSLAVNGVCLTVILIDGEHVIADVGPETARVTTFAGLQRGQELNLERPMRGDGRVDGHFVLGHVDGVGVIEEIRTEGESQVADDWVSADPGAVFHTQGLGGGRWREPDDRRSGRKAVRRDGDSVHLGPHLTQGPQEG